MPGGQTHGLVAHRSIGNENSRVGAIGKAARQQFRAVLLDGRSMAAVGRRAVEAWRDFADQAGRGAAPQLWQRKPGVAVLGSCVHPIDGDVGDP